MTRKSEILIELKEISKVLAEFDASTPYVVPDGYFEGLAGQILTRLHPLQEETTLSIRKSELTNPFTVPPDYFESLSDIILNRIKVQASAVHQEDRTFSSPESGEAAVTYLQPFEEEITLSIQNSALKNPYAVPSGYFEGLSDILLNRINAGQASVHPEEVNFFSPALGEPAFVSQDFEEEVAFSFQYTELNNPYTVPSDYFESLSGIILNRIKAEEALTYKEELKYLSPLLGELSKEVPYSLPGGYFDVFSEDVMAGVNAIDYVNNELSVPSFISTPGEPKNVYAVPDEYFDNLPQKVLHKIKSREKSSLIPMLFGRKIVRYAAAAVFTGIISVSAWLFFGDRSSEKTGSDVSAIENLSNDEISNYLESDSVVPVEGNSIASADIKEEDIKEILSDVSDAELNDYIEQQGLSKDLNAN